MALALEGTHMCTLSTTHAGGDALVHTYLCKMEWNRTDSSLRDLLASMSVRYQFNSHSIPFS